MKLPIFKGFHKSSIYINGAKIDNSRWIISNNIVFSSKECLIFDDDEYLNSPDKCIVETDSICQYIDKRDKYWNRIFTGDILKDEDGIYWLIECLTNGEFNIKALNGDYKNFCFRTSLLDNNTHEVVGNIYSHEILIDETKQEVCIVHRNNSNQ